MGQGFAYSFERRPKQLAERGLSGLAAHYGTDWINQIFGLSPRLPFDEFTIEAKTGQVYLWQDATLIAKAALESQGPLRHTSLR